MNIQEIYNHQHQLKHVPIAIRAAYLVPAFVLTICTHSYVFHVGVYILYLFMSNFFCKVSFAQLFKLHQYPLLFVLIGSLTLALSYKESMAFTLTSNSKEMALAIFFRSSAMISMVFFGLLTHTISEIAIIMRWSRVPSLFVDLFVLTYKFILNLSTNATQMYTAQKLRLSDANHHTVLKSYSLLIFSVFRRAIQQSHQLDLSIQSRLGTEAFSFLSSKKHYQNQQLIAPIMVFIVLGYSFFILNNYGQ